MQVILFEPQIPQNTGNIARTCAVTGTDLCLVRPLGFSTSSRQIKRAGLDYWEHVNISYIDDLEGLLTTTSSPFYCFSSHAPQVYTDAHYEKDALLIFGSETSGLPAHFYTQWPDRFFTVPMRKDKTRCLNLSNTVAIVLYEALRQQGFNF